MKNFRNLSRIAAMSFITLLANNSSGQTQGFYPSTGVPPGSSENLTTINTISTNDPNWKSVGIQVDDPEILRTLHIRKGGFSEFRGPDDPFTSYSMGIRLDMDISTQLPSGGTGTHRTSWDLANSGAFSIYNVDNDRIDFSILPSNGYTGIGAYIPQGRLDIVGGYEGPSDAVYIGASPTIANQGGIMHHQYHDYAWQEVPVNTAFPEDGSLRFHYTHRSSPAEKMKADVLVLHSSGKVGINTNSPQYELDVHGQIHSCEVIVNAISGWCDYVFDNEYNLPELSSVEAYIKANRHLPEVPSEQEVVDHGINLGDMNTILLKKIEELTLYMIEQNKQIEAQKNKIEVLEQIMLK